MNSSCLLIFYTQYLKYIELANIFILDYLISMMASFDDVIAITEHMIKCLHLPGFSNGSVTKP